MKNNNTIKKLAEEFTSQTFGTDIPDGFCFSTCFPLSILLDLNQIDNFIICGDAPKNGGFVSHWWLGLDNDGIILDPTIRQFDPNMESVYLGKISENEVTKKYILDTKSFQESFSTYYNIWKEPFTNKQPRTFIRPAGFEDKMNSMNIRTATILYSYIDKLPNKDQFMRTFKCERYFAPIFDFFKTQSNKDKNYINNLIESMPKDFNLLLAMSIERRHINDINESVSPI